MGGISHSPTSEPSETMTESYQALLRGHILEAGQFIEAVFQGARRAAEIPWQRVTVRPVIIKGSRFLQFSYFDGRQETAENLREEQSAARLDHLLALPFNSIRTDTTTESLRVQFSKKGKPILHRERRGAETGIPLDLTHDRAKVTILSEDAPPPFLAAIGITTADGRIRAGRQRKFRQINEFLRLIEETGEAKRPEGRPLRVVDLGCGSAALTFAAYHYLNIHREIPTAMTGVDAKAFLMERHQATADELGWTGLRFQAGRIQEYETADAPDIVLALHACDTATDEALARAVRWRSRLILSAPCCHHHLQAQLSAGRPPDAFRPVLRHGILRERLGDVLTDAFRAHILRLLGYRAEVIEFISVEHTPKNLMIRAVNVQAPPLPALIAEYQALKAYWGIVPHLENLLSSELQPILKAIQP